MKSFVCRAIKHKDAIVAKAGITKGIWQHVFQATLFTLIDLEVAQNVCGHGF